MGKAKKALATLGILLKQKMVFKYDTSK